MNNANLKRICIALELETPDDVMEVMALGGCAVSKSRAHGWTVGCEHKNYRPMSDAEFSAFCRGLVLFLREELDDRNSE